jgi:acyl-CoA oxidase
MRFSNVRVPRKNMLRRYAEIDEEGRLQLKGDLRTLYGIMLETRVWIAGNAPQTLAMALNIGTRYAVVRRQFATIEGSRLERKLLDYQTHMFKFAPLLAYTMVMNISARYLNNELIELKKDLDNLIFTRLDILHHISAGFKAAFSRIAYDGIDTVR